MTVKELKAWLNAMPPDAKVCINQNFRLPEITTVECYGSEGIVVLHECDEVEETDDVE